MKTWLDPQPVAVPPGVASAVGGNPLVSEILVRRGMTNVERIRAFLDPNLYVPASPYELQDLHIAVDRLGIALQEKQRICVWGDFDVDGQTSTTLLVATLQELGGVIQYHIPLRSEESHGVNLPVLKEIIDQGIDLLLTCDTGISAHHAVQFAASQGVDVIITDHHDLPPELPAALAVVNPKRGSPGHPLSGLPGVGVAYELAQALNEHMGEPGGAEVHLDLVALGIVADLALQTGDVRYLLQLGLEKLRQPERLGLQLMLASAGIDPAGLTEEHIGFELGPRLNALGRLGDANQAVDFLTTGDRGQARLITNYLEGLNSQRKLVTSQVFQGAEAQIEADPSLLEHSALVLSHPSWPGGVIGIVASRLVERFHKPVILITSPPGELARGSARSIPGVDISAAIAAHQDLLEGYGGHPMAAGFSMQAESIPAFRLALSETVAEMLSATSIQPSLQIDGQLPLGDLSLDLVTDLERLAPFGLGNPNPVFVAEELQFVGSRPLGPGKDHLLVKLADHAGTEFKAVWWGGGIEQLPGWMEAGELLDLAYSVRSRDYRGQKEMQIEWLEARPVEREGVAIQPKLRQVEVIDHRQDSHPLMKLKEIVSGGKDLLIWAEAEAVSRLAEHGIQANSRFSLEPADGLIIWTIPPGSQQLREVIDLVSPSVVHLFAVDPQMDDLESFTRRLLGLAKYALGRTKGQVKIASLAAATAQREETVNVGLRWLAAGGYLGVQDRGEGLVCLTEGAGEPDVDFESLTNRLRAILEEMRFYRRQFSRAEASALIHPTP